MSARDFRHGVKTVENPVYASSVTRRRSDDMALGIGAIHGKGGRLDWVGCICRALNADRWLALDSASLWLMRDEGLVVRAGFVTDD